MLPDIAAAALGHGAGTVSVGQAVLDREDVALLLGTTVSGVDRMAKVVPATGAVLWTVAASFFETRTAHLSRLDAGVFGVLGSNQIAIRSTRTGALLATHAVAATTPVVAGWQIFDGSTRALTAQTLAAGARRFLTMRQDSQAVSLASIVEAL